MPRQSREQMARQGQPSGWDEVVHLADISQWHWLAPCLARAVSRWRAKGSRDVTIANFSLWHWTSTFRQALRTLGFPSQVCEHFVLYMLRHGGAANDVANNHCSLLDVKKRGAWRTDASVAWYSKSARLNHQVSSLSRKTREAAAALSLQLPSLLCASL